MVWTEGAGLWRHWELRCLLGEMAGVVEIGEAGAAKATRGHTFWGSLPLYSLSVPGVFCDFRFTRKSTAFRSQNEALAGFMDVEESCSSVSGLGNKQAPGRVQPGSGLGADAQG